jgi:nucleoside-diphosphate-sugar epimerase
VSDLSKVRKDLGWEPKVEFDRGLKDLVAWAASVSD